MVSAMPGQLGDTRGTRPGTRHRGRVSPPARRGRGHPGRRRCVHVPLRLGGAHRLLLRPRRHPSPRRGGSPSQLGHPRGRASCSGAALLFGFLLLAGRAHSYAFSAWALRAGRGAARHRLRADHRRVRRQGRPGPLTGVATHRLSRRTRADPSRHGRVGGQRWLLRPLALPRHPRPPADLAGRGRAHRRRRHRVGRDRLRRRPVGAQPGHRLLEHRERRDHRGRLRRRVGRRGHASTPE